MSYGGGYRGRRSGHYDSRRDDRRPPETESQKLRNLILKFGEGSEFHPSSELPVIAQALRAGFAQNAPGIVEGFRMAIIEQPYKTLYLAALLTLLSSKSTAQTEGSNSDPAQVVFDELCKSFQTTLDKLEWRQIRLYTHFFACLTLSKAVSPSSFLDLLQSFLVVLDEPGVSYERLHAAAACAGEGLMRAGPALYSFNPIAVDAIISTINSSGEPHAPQRTISRPILDPNPLVLPEADVYLTSLVGALTSLRDKSFEALPECLPQPHTLFPEPTKLLDIPPSLVPPEEIDFDRAVDEELKRKELMPAISIRMFGNDVTPDPSSPAGFMIRSGLSDVINIFEVNRKECARILLEMPRWFVWGTFRGKSSNFVRAYLTASSPQTIVYYFALVTDLCKLSPQTVGPAVGKSFRKLYAFLGNGLDVEISRRYCEWFAMHMSNFGFNWVWKEWIPDLELPLYHPKRVFIRRVIALEIRLAYYDRILKTLPEPFTTLEARCIPDEAPGPEFEYENQQHPYYEPAQSLLNLIRGRSQIEEVVQFAESMRSNLSETVTLADGATSDSVVRSITMQILLHVGSRSFSHFLNAIERYLPLLRSLGSDPQDKLDFLNAAASFWHRNGQMIGIVFDKLMQYQIVDPTDIIGWCFDNAERRKRDDDGTGSPGTLSFREWDLVKAALDKAIGRVAIAQNRVQLLRKEEEEAKAKLTAGQTRVDDDGMEVDTNGVGRAVFENLNTALKARSILTREQKAALARILDGFVSSLVLQATVGQLDTLKPGHWDLREQWTQAQWQYWETFGWYRHFCRNYLAQLKSYTVTLESGPLAKATVTGDRAAAGTLMMSVWNVALGRGHS
ncbi:armadillo-type protein [Cantharellus anzutake]|uniref:armadillo-type protein n=1 Tax=Cantharellus anzutake TaxID=1750568 RepID=UPI001906F826|nr:armadillo-type protein [Cantharellus anzutake]KAF8341647.1 armadillo-type protein [Cantharellus anzutake]